MSCKAVAGDIMQLVKVFCPFALQLVKVFAQQ
jgi:hypothetical protein